MYSIVTIAEDGAAESQDLTDRFTVKLDLGINDGNSDDQIDLWIPQASAIISAYCDRVFRLESLVETFRLPRAERSHRELRLSRYPVGEVTAVTEDGTALIEADFEVEPTMGLLHRLSNDCPISWCARKVVVEYDAGYADIADVPLQLQKACIALVRYMRTSGPRDATLKRVKIEGISEREYWVPPSGDPFIPGDVAELLLPFRRIKV